MRTFNPLDALFPRVRQAVLAATILHPDRWWYLRDLASHLRVSPSSLQRDLSALVAAGILHKRQDGNRIYYQPDPNCPFLSDLQGLFAKTIGLADVLREVLAPFDERIAFAFVHGSMARGDYTSASDVDLVVIGSVRLAEMAVGLRTAEKKLERPVNPTLYSLQELAQKLSEGHHFLRTVMTAEKLFLKGNADELVQALGRTQGPVAHDQ